MRAVLIGAALMLGSVSVVQAAERLPTKVGQCANTRVVKISDRFGDPIGAKDQDGISGGTSIRLANDGYQVSYETVPTIERTRVGDRVIMCLVFIPQDCPKGDKRGKIYTTVNLRLKASWSLPDAPHSCGGA